MKNDKLEILKNKYPIINLLQEKRVIEFGSDYETGFDGSCWIVEACDNWYGHDLSKKDCVQLSNFFQELSSIITE